MNLTDSLCMQLECVLESIEEAFKVVCGVLTYDSDVVAL